MRILVDLDGIVADFFKTLLHLYNGLTWDYCEEVTADRILGWDMGSYVDRPELLETIYRTPGFFLRLEPVSGAVESLKQLQDSGHEIVIVSSPCTPHSAAEKISWCEQYLPFIDKKNVWLGHRKYQLQGDVLIDDGMHNAMAYRRNHPDALIYTIAYGYNEDPDHVYNGRFYGYGRHGEAAGAAWAAIVEAIEEETGHHTDAPNYGMMY